MRVLSFFFVFSSPVGVQYFPAHGWMSAPPVRSIGCHCAVFCSGRSTSATAQRVAESLGGFLLIQFLSERYLCYTLFWSWVTSNEQWPVWADGVIRRRVEKCDWDIEIHTGICFYATFTLDPVFSSQAVAASRGVDRRYIIPK